MRVERRKPTMGEAFMVGALVILTIIVMVQTTRRAWLPPSKTDELVLTVLAAVGAALILRSDWGKGVDAAKDQLALGTLSNSFYGPRREAITEGGAVLGGVLGGLWWGASTWVILLTGIRHGDVRLGLRGFEISIVVGALSGGMIGAAAGRLVGNRWEHYHRQQRLKKAQTS